MPSVPAMASGALLVVKLKHTSNVFCPSQLQLFGGTHPLLMPFMGEVGAKPGVCWPGGHSSHGFAMLPIYFALRERLPQLAGWALLFIVLWGNLLGFIRVIQGAHFLSHQIWSWAICWAAALAWLPLLHWQWSLSIRQLLRFSAARPAPPTGPVPTKP